MSFCQKSKIDDYLQDLKIHINQIRYLVFPNDCFIWHATSVKMLKDVIKWNILDSIPSMLMKQHKIRLKQHIQNSTEKVSEKRYETLKRDVERYLGPKGEWSFNWYVIQQSLDNVVMKSMLDI